ncbi:LOB domain-containing protein 29 [Punica granatum]|uniref:LOB domain-containing protein 29 n=1 Tax=Punica granatum TaxID=22663 RepID=A0A218WMS0_PUNGR|nr:LOB domain-containing protein 29 [Punica granatum]XP_031374370.1 LOB domain-containing protein 29 [Punica granatum]OWM73903.1 hypothetical protein CDL15_Pgr018963 [Punica granatum]
MTGSGSSSGSGCGSPCGACKFLRRKCVQGCVFAPYFCHEQGVTHFAAIHKVFGASNVSKLLTHLPVSDRAEAAVTISYEAQARLHDPIYGCVSHIFALQQQVVNLQAQLASLKEQAAQSISNANTCANPNSRYHGKLPSPTQDWQSWARHIQTQSSPQYDPNHNGSPSSIAFGGIGFPNSDSVNYENSAVSEENASFTGYREASGYSIPYLDMETSNEQWTLDDADDLRTIAFRYSQNS